MSVKNDYTLMWDRLNLDLSAHEALLAVLGKFYNDIYLSQDNRLHGMEYLDFVLSEIHGARIKELLEAKDSGKKVIGTFCIFVPEELTIAAGGIQVGLCAGADAGTEAAEKIVPPNTCALIKSFIGFKLARLCPFIESCDLIVGETTCDGKKKAYESFADYVPLWIMEVPQKKDDADRRLWRSEVMRYKEKLEEITGNRITGQKLFEAIKTVNNKRRVLGRLNRIRALEPSPISGRDALLVNQISFYDDPVRFTRQVSLLCDEIEYGVKNGRQVVPAGTPRILLSGCPMAVPNWKLPFVIEGSGAVVVGEESCIGTRNTRDLVDESACDPDSLDSMIDALCDRYMKIDCACFTPNIQRLENIRNLARTLKVSGVVQYILKFCQPYAIEALKVERMLKEEGIPVLTIETDYSTDDISTLKTRVEAFVEMISNSET